MSRAQLSAWLFDIKPRPQLKLVLVGWSEEYTKPQIQRSQGFPLMHYKKKIDVEEELIHKELKAAQFSRIRQEGELTGLRQIIFDLLTEMEPSHLEIADGSVEDIND